MYPWLHSQLALLTELIDELAGHSSQTFLSAMNIYDAELQIQLVFSAFGTDVAGQTSQAPSMYT